MAEIVMTTNLAVSKAILIDEVDASVTYIGMAKVGTLTGDSKWQIRKITKTGTVTAFEFADGNERYDNEWDERTNLSYS